MFLWNAENETQGKSDENLLGVCADGLNQKKKLQDDYVPIMSLRPLIGCWEFELVVPEWRVSTNQVSERKHVMFYVDKSTWTLIASIWVPIKFPR